MNLARRALLAVFGGPLVMALAALGASLFLARAFSSEKGEAGSRLAPYRLPLAARASLDPEIEAFEVRLRRNPGGAIDQALLARAYLQKAKLSGPRWYELAEKNAQESLRKLPVSNTGAKLVLAQVAQARHQFARSLELCEEVRKEKPGGMEALCVMMTGLMAEGKVSESARLADEVIARFPTMGAYVAHGLVMTAQGREREAIYDFTRAIELEEEGDLEESSRARMLLGRLHLQHGRREAARDLLQEAIRIDPGNVQALGWMGDLELAEGHAREAGLRYSDAFQRSGEARYLGKKADALRRAGETHSSRALRDETERLLRSSLSRDSFGHRRQLAECLLERGDPGAAKEALELLLDESAVRRDWETLAALARALVRAGRTKEAQGAVREALRSGVEDAPLQLLAARIERELGNERRARFHLENALLVDPTCPVAKEGLPAGGGLATPGR